MNLQKLKNRALELSYKHNLGHIGSVLTTLEILYDIYKDKGTDDIVILSNGHAGLAQYICIEELYSISAESLLDKCGVHPKRDPDNHIYVSSGSLGCGIAIAVGMALANSKRVIHCVISDGECAEGLVWESLAFIYNYKVANIKVYVNMNGYSAYDRVNEGYLANRLRSFLPSINIFFTDSNFSFARGVDSHYRNLTKESYEREINANRIE